MGFTGDDISPENKRRLKWVGMFVANSSVLSLAVGTLLWAGLTSKFEAYADDRYAPKRTEEQVQANTEVLQQVQSEVRALSGNVQSFQGLWMRKEMYALRVQQCQAVNDVRRRELSEQLQEMRREYRLQIGEEPPSRSSCEDL